jgi:hypothetical protein
VPPIGIDPISNAFQANANPSQLQRQMIYGVNTRLRSEVIRFTAVVLTISIYSLHNTFFGGSSWNRTNSGVATRRIKSPMPTHFGVTPNEHHYILLTYLRQLLFAGMPNGIRTHTVRVLSPLPPTYCATGTL